MCGSIVWEKITSHKIVLIISINFSFIPRHTGTACDPRLESGNETKHVVGLGMRLPCQ